MLERDNDYEHFFYNAGLHIGGFFGHKSMAFKFKVINQFKAFVDAHGGVDRFSSSEYAVRSFIRKTKGGAYVQKY
jgi:hypothetical protein